MAEHSSSAFCQSAMSISATSPASADRIRIEQSSSSVKPAEAEARIGALDGLRGALTLMVVLSHYFAEVPHSISMFAFGWIAVAMFFVLSGFLVGHIIIEKKHHDNFIKVYFARRACRILPVYMLSVVLIFALNKTFEGAEWMQSEAMYPLWSYLTFNQNLFMVANNNVGVVWLSPTWTLTMEVQFYLLAPLVFLCAPRHRWFSYLAAVVVLALAFRAAVFAGHVLPSLGGLCLLPAIAGSMICGLVAAILYNTKDLDLKRHEPLLRVGLIAMLVLTMAIKYLEDDNAIVFEIVANLLVGIGGAMYVLALVNGAPEAKRLEGKFFRFFGHNSYSIYLTHWAVLFYMHGLILGTKPDIGTASQVMVTIAAVGVSVIVGYILTKYVERPMIAYGQSWKWGSILQQPAGHKSPLIPKAA